MKTFNDTVRFVVGLVVMYAAYRLHAAGVFTRLGSLIGFSSGYGSGYGGVSDILLTVLPTVVDSVCFIGSVALAFFGFCWKALKPLAHKLLLLLDRKLESYGIDIYEQDNLPKIDTDIDADALTEVLEDLNESIDSISERLSLIEGSDEA